MTTRKQTTPDWLVERLALGELDAAAAADVRRRLAAEGRDVEGELAALVASSREILEAHPPARVAAAVRGRAPKPELKPNRWVAFAPLVLGAALALVLFARPKAETDVTTAGSPSLDIEETSIKGAPELNVYRRGAAESERLREGARAARGDLLQLTYRSGWDTFGALLSIDGRGNVTVHWPEGDAAAAARLSAKGEVKLPSAYELDDAPDFERFFLVTSDAPFAMPTVVGAARALAARPAAARVRALDLPPSLHQASLTLAKIRKETP